MSMRSWSARCSVTVWQYSARHSTTPDEERANPCRPAAWAPVASSAMLDLRRIRSEPEAVRAELDRRGRGPSAVSRPDPRPRRRAASRPDLGATRCAARSRPSPGRWAGSGARAEPTRPRPAWPRAASWASVRRPGGRRRPAGRRSRSAASSCATPNTPSADAPDGADEADNVVLRTERGRPNAYAHHQRVSPTGTSATSCACSTSPGRRQDLGRCSSCTGAGVPLLRAMVQLSLDRNADAYEEVRPPPWCSPRRWSRPGTCPSSPMTPTTSSATTCGPSPPPRCPSPRCTERGPRRDRSAVALRRITSCFRRRRARRQGHSRPAARPRVRQGRAAGRGGRRRAGDRRCQEDVLARSESLLRTLGLAYRVLDLCTGGPGCLGGTDLGHRGLRPPAATSGSRCRRCRGSPTTRLAANVRCRPRPGPRRQGHPRAIAHTVNGRLGLAPHRGCLPGDHRRPDASSPSSTSSPPSWAAPTPYLPDRRPDDTGTAGPPAAGRHHGEVSGGNRCCHCRSRTLGPRRPIASRRDGRWSEHASPHGNMGRQAHGAEPAGEVLVHSSNPCPTQADGQVPRRRGAPRPPAHDEHTGVMVGRRSIRWNVEAPGPVDVGDDAQLLEAPSVRHRARCTSGWRAATRAAISSAVTWWSPDQRLDHRPRRGDERRRAPSSAGRTSSAVGAAVHPRGYWSRLRPGLRPLTAVGDPLPASPGTVHTGRS